MLVKLYSATVNGLEVTTITVEVSVVPGQGFFLSGLGDEAVRESQSRIRSAFHWANYKFPNLSVTINLAPADIRKEGTSFDLPIAVGILAGNEELVTDRLADYMLVGELGLDGTLQPVKGVLPIAMQAKKDGFRGIIIPKANEREAAVVSGIDVYGFENITEVIAFLMGETDVLPLSIDVNDIFYQQQYQAQDLDFADVKGQENIKRAMEVAAAGGHNIIMVGTPGSGKSMMAKRLPGILPPLSLSESLETTQIHSVAGKLGTGTTLITQRPFRSPHHTTSQVALVGGGSNPSPGEISLAHNGVMFCDELPEWSKRTLEVLRQPLEDRRISISRAKYSVDYPASFMFVAAMNPCPCGYHGDPTHNCTCTPGMIQRYMNKISGPLLDRIDLQVEVANIKYSELSSAEPGEPSSEIRKRVLAARQIQTARYENVPGIHCNAQMTDKMLREYCVLDEKTNTMLQMAMIRLNLSARAYSRILKVARTIADLDNKPNIEMSHIAEAISYRSLDRGDFCER